MPQKYNSSRCFANFIVIATLPSLFFVAMVLGYLQLIPLNVPIHSLVMIGFILFVFLLFVRHNANYSICAMRSAKKHLTFTLDEKLKHSSLQIEDKVKSILDIEHFLLEYFSDVRNDNFVSVASSIFPMLGILGTFVAIALSMPNFSVENTQALDNEISLLLNGVGSAFFASIYGIFLSLIWTYFEKRGLSKIEHYFSEIRQEFQKYIWSKEELLIYKYTQYDIKENRFIAALKETFNLDFIKELNQHHLNSYEKIVTQTRKDFETLSHELLHVSQELRKTLHDMDTSTSALQAQHTIQNSLKEFTQATHDLEKSTKVFSAQLNNSLNRTFEKIDTEIGDIVIKLADFATHVSLESKEVQDSIAKYHNMVANHMKEK